jgi:sugar (pentulose or hexulose) kinase
VTLVGIDIGTTSIKAAVFDLDGHELAEAREPTPWRATELDPAALRSATLAAAGAALAEVDGAVAAVGVTGIAETGILLDGHGRPVVPALAWHDPRGGEHAADLQRRLGDRFAERVGLPVRALCSLVKYAWMREHWPDAARGVRWLSVAEWIVRELGGEEAAESSLASRTAFYDLHTRAPWDEALEWAGAPPGLAPEHLPAGTPLGTANGTLHRARGATLAVGGHDHLAAAVGAGVADPGEVLDSWGTAEAWIRATEPLAPEQVKECVEAGITVGWHAIDTRQALLGAARSGAALQSVLDLVGGDPTELDPAALHADPGDIELAGFPDGPFTITGLDRGASPAALYRAAHESLGREAARVLERMDAIAGPRTRLVVTGGWAEGQCAREVKARHLGPFEHAPGIATGARGAALAALRAHKGS